MNGTLYLHCRNCMPQKPPGKSAKQWSRLEVSVEGSLLRVRCVRCNMGVGDFTLAVPVIGTCEACDKGVPHVH